ncbi:unnamed protein product [Sphagnum jensenii]|uniref:U6 small nuclear RNA (adenine-(43)-N(6))-methyltransferase n=1 Tax=Sphagnum jensenii TaxID=128206 RepID=A0ABP1AR29_9BRYO
MSSSRKSSSRKRKGVAAAMHPRNKYAENAPDFSLLASKYPAFRSFVSYGAGANNRPRIDWTDFNATRELTRVLLDHDYGIKWWIPDGQLCPTVTNRANYIHWIEDLLASCPAPWHQNGEHEEVVCGIDIGTGANCIYPLLGTALHKWHFVATDITAVALSWAQKNIQSNPSVADLIEVRSSLIEDAGGSNWDTTTIAAGNNDTGKEIIHHSTAIIEEGKGAVSSSEAVVDTKHAAILVGVVKEGERFDFCMCNPPFFTSMAEANANPRTACGGTEAEMVYPGGEEVFVARMIEDSATLKHKIHWYTTMIGRKLSLKVLTAKLWTLGVAAVRTTEFVQGHTSRWGLAWSFTAPPKIESSKTSVQIKSNVSFMLEGLRHGCSAVDVLQGLISQLQSNGVLCKLDLSSFSINVSILGLSFNSSLHPIHGYVYVALNCICQFMKVFQQAPGSLLIKASLGKGASFESGKLFMKIFENVEQALKEQFNLKQRRTM